MLRATVRCRVRTAVSHNSGTLNDGNPWQNWTFEGVDLDDNKVTFHLQDGQIGAALAIGDTVDLVVDISVKNGKLRNTVRQIEAVKAGARSSAA